MKLAHCSDLHLLSLEGAKFLDFANKRWIGGLNLLSNRGRHYHSEIFEALVADVNAGDVDHLLVTGDITNLALPDEFRFARDLFEGLRLGPEHVTVLPGNHDAYVQRGAHFFTEHFAPFFRSDDEFHDPNAPWPLVRVRGDVAMIGLSTSLQTPWFTAYGVIGDEQLGRVRELLADERLASKVRIVAIHHPPAGPPARSRIRGLRDREALAEVLAEVGAELVLHGHEHRDLSFELPGPVGGIPVRGIQSGTYEAGRHDRRARYRIYEVEDGRVVGEALRVWDPKSREFIADDGAEVREPASTAAANGTNLAT